MNETTENNLATDANLDTPPSEAKIENSQPETILCLHCLRTATNGIKCKGICVADSHY